MNDDTMGVAKELLGLPEQIKEEELKLIRQNNDHDGLDLQKKRLERRAWGIVSNAVDADGKKLYTNEKQREMAVEAALEADFDYKALEAEQLEKRLTIKITVIEKDYLERRFKALTAIARMLSKDS